MAQMPDIPVHAVGIGIFFRFIVDGDVVCFSISQFIFTRFEVPHPPRSDQRHFRSQGFNRQFKTDLVIALAGSAVSNGFSPFFFSDFYEFFRNEGRAKDVPRRYFPS